MKAFAFTMMFLLVAGVAAAADIDGKWSGQFASPMGGDPMTLSYNFKAEGSTLTGTTIGGPEGQQIPIKDGKIDGNNISFIVAVDMGGTEMKLNYKGVLAGDEIKLTFEMAGMPAAPEGAPAAPPMSFTVKRVK